MNRRGFLGLFTAGVAGIALDQAIPLGRVWSFPSKIVIPKPGPLTVIETVFRVGDVVSFGMIPNERFIVKAVLHRGEVHLLSLNPQPFAESAWFRVPTGVLQRFRKAPVRSRIVDSYITPVSRPELRQLSS